MAVPKDHSDKRERCLDKLLSDRVTKLLVAALGQRLTAVDYNCLQGESDGSDLVDRSFYWGGELALHFCGGGPPELYITWDENAGWDLHFSVLVSLKSIYNAGALKRFPASELSIWSDCIGEELLKASVYALEKTPCMVVLELGDEVIAAGCACGGLQPIRFGDGDDVFVKSYSASSTAPERLELIWTSG